MKEKGFTLIELLAIIVILAIIAVITIPQIMNVVEDSKKSATKDSAYGYKNAVHQYYLTNSSNDDEFDLNGSYDVIDGAIVARGNTYNISVDGEAPKSGSITVEDGEIIEGCIDYGKYSVIIENGNVTEAAPGACYDISYFTYDENAESGREGNITSKLSSPDLSWPYYVKEYNYINKYIYGIWNNEYEDFVSPEFYLFDSLDKCQRFLSENDFDSEYDECRKFLNDRKYQICFVYSDQEYCFVPTADNYTYNYNILNDIFDGCQRYHGTNICGPVSINESGFITAGACTVGIHDFEISSFYTASCSQNQGSIK